MNIPLFLNSTDGIRNSKSHDFTISFTPELTLNKNKKYYVALDSLNMSYSWYNVAASYNNNTLLYSHDSGTNWTTITLPDGNNSYDDLNRYIQQVLQNNGHSKTGVKLTFISSLFRVQLTLENGFQLDLRTGYFSDLIGYNKAIITSTGYGSSLPDITRSVDNKFIHTNIISDSIISGIQSDILSRFSVDNLPLSYPFYIEGRRPLYNKINTNVIKELRIYITDAFNRLIDLNNIPVNMTLLLREE